MRPSFVIGFIFSLFSTTGKNVSAMGHFTVCHKAFILGASGEVGKELIKAINLRKEYATINLINRRNIVLDSDVDQTRFSQHIVNFEKLENYKEVFENCDIGFCCLCTTRAKSGSKGLWKVNHDYVVNAAKIAKKAGCKQFHIISTQGAKTNSLFIYYKIKGKVEEKLKLMENLTV